MPIDDDVQEIIDRFEKEELLVLEQEGPESTKFWKSNFAYQLLKRLREAGRHETWKATKAYLIDRDYDPKFAVSEFWGSVYQREKERKKNRKDFEAVLKRSRDLIEKYSK